MKKVLVLYITILFFAGCSTMTSPRYSVSLDNNIALKKYEGNKVKIASMTPPDSYNPNCRLAGPIQASDGMTIPQFVQKAFNDELKFANLYAENGIIIDGSLTKVVFSSTSKMTNGWWELDLTLKSSNGKSMNISSHYEFNTGFDPNMACKHTAEALVNAVQDLIKKTVTNHQFATLLR